MPRLHMVWYPAWRIAAPGERKMPRMATQGEKRMPRREQDVAQGEGCGTRREEDVTRAYSAA